TVKSDLHAPTSQASSPQYNNTGTITVSYSALETGGSGLKEVDLYVEKPGESSYSLAMKDVAGVGSGIDNTFAYTVPTLGSDYVQGTFSFYTVSIDVADNYELPPPGNNGDTTTTETLQDSIAPSLTV